MKGTSSPNSLIARLVRSMVALDRVGTSTGENVHGLLRDSPRPSDKVEDASFGREIHLRRHAKKARVTIFEGGHEGIATAAIAWLEQHVRAE